MPIEVIMPKVDMDMDSGKVMSWHVAVGETVTKGEPLFDIETDKAAMEVESPDSGILHHPAAEGSQIPIGQPVAWLYAEGEEVGDPPRTQAAAPVSDPEPEAATPQAANAAQVAAPAAPLGNKTRATPLARRLARQGNIDLASIAGTGLRGRVQANDLRGLLDQPAPVPTPVNFTAETGPLSVSHKPGGSGTPVVLIHGFANDGTSWAPLEAHLKHRPLIRIDLPGHGNSPRRRIADFADLVKQVRTAFDDLELDQAHLVGHSLGGALALALADTRARSVASLSLIAPAGLGAEVNGAALNGICTASRAESLGPWLRSLVANESLITDGYARVAMAARSEPNLRAAQSHMADALFPDGVQAFDLRAALDRVAVPTSIIWGKRDAVIPWRHALRAPGRVALHLFDDVGHMPQFERAEDIGKIITSLV